MPSGRPVAPSRTARAGGAHAGSPPGGRHRYRRLYAGVAWLAVVVAGAVLAGLTLLPRSGPPPARTIVASLPYWNISQGAATVLAHQRDVTEVSPWMYGLTPAGAIAPQYPPGQAGAVTTEIARLRAAGLRVVPTLANITGGNWAYQPVATILHDPARMRAHVAAIAALVRAHHFAGIDIDYEDLRAGDRQAFSAFVAALGAALHKEGATLSVAVFAKTTNAGVDQRNVAQDYAAIGKVADQVRLMAYDYHWDTSGPGPVAPIGWVRDVLRYAKTQIPASKIILGVPLYGYDWSGGRGAAITWLQAFRLSGEHHVRARYDTASQSPWFEYTAGGRTHVVWFENQASTQAKLAAARGAGVGGVFLWMFGYEAPGTWAALHQTLPLPAAANSGAAGSRGGS